MKLLKFPGSADILALSPDGTARKIQNEDAFKEITGSLPEEGVNFKTIQWDSRQSFGVDAIRNQNIIKLRY